MTDLLIRGGLLVDGTGSPARTADVAVSGGRVEAVGDLTGRAAARVVEARGRVVCPGFVDVHSHSDLALLSNPPAHSKIRQGVTTEVLGNCGLGVLPLTPETDTAALRAAVAFIDADPAVEWSWRSLADYRAVLAGARPSVNTASLVGHLPLRAAVVGFADRPATPAEVTRMCGLLAEALDEGAAGLSTGLIYAPACYADEAELIALAGVVAAYGRVFSWHLRDYTDRLLESVGQAVRVAEASGCRTQISHLAAVGRRNWGGVAEALRLIEAADADVHADVYPYLAGSANLSQLLPGWAHDGGEAAMRLRLRDPLVRDRIRAEWAGRWWEWADVVVDGSPLASDDHAMDLVAEHGNSVAMVASGRSEDDLLAALTHPATVIGSDGLALDPAGPTGRGTPHPRSYGCYPRLLHRYVGPGRLTLEQAVRKCTAGPAELFGLAGRGLIRPGAAADLLLLDLEKIEDLSTFTHPHRYPAGIDLVVVNGTVVIHDGVHTGARPGRDLRVPTEVTT
ncbi:N-acyl-D-amino-acid deacylase family protein [Rhizohabitans arisaemae]|uniref:N-acyl-D-amino-acid deacylase family protein n=1 Tax=Rhizohabitans arisaemae TaxID=2720610 RepID=UPI0024B1345F|nr:D-aminoacylase [Rhizohabitans arisaemae]